MVDWQLKIDNADDRLRQLAPKIKELRAELKMYELIFTMYAKAKWEHEKHIVPIKKLLPKATNNKPEMKAETMLKKAKAMKSNERKELLKALEGMM